MTLFASSDGTLLASRDGPIGRLVFANERRHNAVTAAGWEGLASAVAALEAAEGVRVVIVTGAGERAFVSGSDISEFDRLRSAEEAIRRYGEIAEAGISRLAACALPTLARIRGHCLGGGIAIAIACDLRLASDDAGFAIPAARLGLSYRLPDLWRILQAIGPAHTLDLFLTARRWSALEAQGAGLVNKVVPAAELDALVADWAGRIAANAPLTLRATRKMVALALRPPDDAAAREAERLALACFASEDYAEGRAAFAERRRPVFKGR